MVQFDKVNFVWHSESPTEQFGMNLKALGVQDRSCLIHEYANEILFI